MKSLTAPVDNGNSYAGLYGLANPVTTWLISRGHGELVALPVEEMLAPDPAPLCREHDRPRPMLYRTDGWACYEHKEPVRIKRPLRTAKVPPAPFSTFEVIGKTVELHYHRDHDGRSRWVWLVDGEEWRRR